MPLRKLSPLQWRDVLAGPPSKAARLLKAAALYGLVEAQTLFGQMLLDGNGVARDQAAAAGWFAIAAGAGHPPACNMLGRCCERGWGLPVDFPRAATCYRQAAEAGLDWGQYNLANMLLRGRGVCQDRAQALAWFRCASAQNHAKSVNLVGRFHEEGWGIPADHAAARDCYRRAAEGGDFRGQYNLASLLALEGDIAAAQNWLEMVLRTAPADFLAVMADRLTSSDAQALRAIGEKARKEAVLFRRNERARTVETRRLF